MSDSATSPKNLIACLAALGGAAAAIFISGSQQEWANVVFAVGAGLCGMLAVPRVRAGWLPVLLGAAFCLASLAALLPVSWFAVPTWRGALPPTLSALLADAVCPQPWLLGFWWGLLVLTFLLGLVLLTVPLEGPKLAAFLQAVALLVGIYAAMSVFAHQTGWKYPFGGGAPFGFLPNKNHTATLLVTGAIVSFGLMQWSVARGRRVTAVVAAICGAPPLAALLFFSNSRAGVVFLGAGLLLWAAGAGRHRSRKVILAGAAILVAFLAVLFVAGGSEVRTRLATLWQEAVAVDAQPEDESAGDLDFRQPIFRDTLRLIGEQPLTGLGLGQFRYVFPQYRKESVRAARILHPESDWLMVAGESGVPAAVVLLGFVVWYARRSWQSRTGTDGLLRWTAASAVLAAVLHGAVDVPWHRPAVGWFIFVLALAAMPKSQAMLKHPAWLRGLFVIGGAGVLALAFLSFKDLAAGNPPMPYRWAEYNQRLADLGARMDYEAGEALSAEALGFYPLEKDAHYWVLAFSEAGGAELEAVIGDARAVEPALPQVAQGQAALWRGVDASREAEAWSEAVRRAARIDRLQNNAKLDGARGMVDGALQSLRENEGAQIEFLERLGSEPLLQAFWFRSASPGAAETWLARQMDTARWLDTLPEDFRAGVLDRWVALASGARAAGYMEERGGATAYWRQLSDFYARTGNKERAVRVVAAAEGISLEARPVSGGFGAQLAGLQAQGNEVAVRRLLKEAVEAKKADAEKLSVAVPWYAAAGDWEMAWKAASRLATARKNGQ